MSPDFSHARWIKPSRSQGQDDHCVELACVSGTVGVRDSKNRSRGHLVLEESTWTLLLRGALSGDLDLVSRHSSGFKNVAQQYN